MGQSERCLFTPVVGFDANNDRSSRTVALQVGNVHFLNQQTAVGVIVLSAAASAKSVDSLDIVTFGITVGKHGSHGRSGRL